MNITFYKNNSDKRYLNKTLSNALVVSGVSLYDSTSVTNPVLKVSGGATKIATYNYLYIPDFNRYYYITDFTVENGYILVSCKVDVLMSYASAISACECVAKRQENAYNFYLHDDRFKTYAYKNLFIHKFTSPFTKASKFILTVNG